MKLQSKQWRVILTQYWVRYIGPNFYWIKKIIIYPYCWVCPYLTQYGQAQPLGLKVPFKLNWKNEPKVGVRQLSIFLECNISILLYFWSNKQDFSGKIFFFMKFIKLNWYDFAPFVIFEKIITTNKCFLDVSEGFKVWI